MSQPLQELCDARLVEMEDEGCSNDHIHTVWVAMTSEGLVVLPVLESIVVFN